jgi:hypothetical protein
MAVNYSGTLKTNRMQLVADLVASKTIASPISTGAGSAGSLVIGTSSLSGATGVLATIPLQNPAATVSGSVMTISGVPLTANASAGGTAALAELRNNAGTAIVSGLTVGTATSDVIVTTVTVVSGQPVTVTSGTITHS